MANLDDSCTSQLLRLGVRLRAFHSVGEGWRRLVDRLANDTTFDRTRAIGGQSFSDFARLVSAKRLVEFGIGNPSEAAWFHELEYDKTAIAEAASLVAILQPHRTRESPPAPPSTTPEQSNDALVVCERCRACPGLKGERYCADCKKTVLRELKEVGYLRPARLWRERQTHEDIYETKFGVDEWQDTPEYLDVDQSSDE